MTATNAVNGRNLMFTYENYFILGKFLHYSQLLKTECE